MPIALIDPVTHHAPATPLTPADHLLTALTRETRPTHEIGFNPPEDLRHFADRFYALSLQNFSSLTESRTVWRREHATRLRSLASALRTNPTLLEDYASAISAFVDHIESTPLPTPATPPSTSIYSSDELTALFTALSTPSPTRAHITAVTPTHIDIESPAITWTEPGLIIGPFKFRLTFSRIITHRNARTFECALTCSTYRFPSPHPHMGSVHHPHINSGGSICWGNFLGPLRLAIETANIPELLTLIFQHLSIYNTRSPFHRDHSFIPSLTTSTLIHGELPNDHSLPPANPGEQPQPPSPTPNHIILDSIPTDNEDDGDADGDEDEPTEDDDDHWDDDDDTDDTEPDTDDEPLDEEGTDDPFQYIPLSPPRITFLDPPGNP